MSEGHALESSSVAATARTGARAAPRVPGALPWLGHALPFGRDPNGFLRTQRARFGEAFHVSLPGGGRTFLLDPLDYGAFFQERRLVFRDVANEMGSRVFGYTMDAARQADMALMSHMIGKLMKGDHLAVLTARMQGLLGARLSEAIGVGWTDGALLAWLNEHVFAAGVEALFGEGFYSRPLFDSYAKVDRYFALLAAGVPARSLPGCREARDHLAHAAGDFARPGRSTLMQERRAQYLRTGTSDEQAARMDASLIWAAEANTIAALFWSLAYIVRDATARRAIEHEVRSTCGDMSLTGATLTDEQLRRMKRLDAAVSEVLRLTAVPIVVRRATEALELERASGAPLRIEAGESVALYPHLTHVDAEIFPHPYSFDVERFASEQGAPTFTKRGTKVNFAFLPFGGGVSMCPGRFFARNEIKTLVAMLLLHFDFELQAAHVPPLDWTRVGLGVLPPTQDLPFAVRRRAR